MRNFYIVYQNGCGGLFGKGPSTFSAARLLAALQDRQVLRYPFDESVVWKGVHEEHSAECAEQLAVLDKLLPISSIDRALN